jgi:hypothetical protein
MKVLYSILAGLLLFTLASCSGKKSGEAEEAQGLPVFHFEQQDSVAIRNLAQDYVDRINHGDMEGAAGLLYIVRNDSLLSLPTDKRQEFIEHMKLFGKYGCAQKELELYSDRDNQLRIALKIVESGNLETGEGTTNMFLNPVQKDGQWYLTLLDTHAEGVGVYHHND